METTQISTSLVGLEPAILASARPLGFETQTVRPVAQSLFRLLYLGSCSPL